MIRTTTIPSESNVIFQIPDDYIGKEIEIIAFEKNEGQKEIEKAKKKFRFTIATVDNNNYKFDRDEANER